jgi:hypothetical protein
MQVSGVLSLRFSVKKSLGGIAGRLIPNFLADRVGSFNVIIPVIFLGAGCVLAMLAVALNSGGIIAISLLYGAMNAGCGCNIQPTSPIT